MDHVKWILAPWNTQDLLAPAKAIRSFTAPSTTVSPVQKRTRPRVGAGLDGDPNLFRLFSHCTGPSGLAFVDSTEFWIQRRVLVALQLITVANLNLDLSAATRLNRNFADARGTNDDLGQS